MVADPLPTASVIVPAYRARTLQQCIDHLVRQDYGEPYEIIVCVSADEEAALPDLRPEPNLRVIRHVPRLSAAEARNRAVAMSRGSLLAFTDADVLVEPEWLRLLTAASNARDCIAGAVINGTPTSAAGTVEYLVEFLDLHPARPPRTSWHGATCNLLIPRDLWDELGPFPEDLAGGEDTLFTVQARSLGRFRFEPSARVQHLNRTRWSDVVLHQVSFGRFTARLGRRSGYKLRTLVRVTALAPVAVFARVVSLYSRVWRWDRSGLTRAIRLAPGVLTVLAGWGWGLFAEGARLDGRAVRQRWRARGKRSPSSDADTRLPTPTA